MVNHGYIMRGLAALVVVLTLIGCSSPCANADSPRILVIGDSFMTSNGSKQKSFSHALASILGTPVKNRAVAAARHLYALPITGGLGLNISKQYRDGPWDFVVMNGGGNDLWLGCGCRPCTRKMDKMISDDGQRGVIPSLAAQARQGGARVIYVGYLRSPGFGSPIEGCKVLGDELEARIAKMAQHDAGVTFVSLAGMVPFGDKRFHAADMIHPSPKGSAEAARLVADIIREAP